MKIQQFRYVLTLASTKNYTRAAKILYITQPTLSQQIQRVEEELGTQLFVRSPHQVELTPAGQAFVEHAEKIMQEWNAALQDLAARHDRTRLRIGLFWTFTGHGVPDVLRLYTTLHPGAKLEFQIGGSVDLLAMLKNRELDMAFITGNYQEQDTREEGFLARIWDRSPLMVIVNSHHPLAARHSLTLKDLDGENVLVSGKHTYHYAYMMRQFAQNNLHPHIIGGTSQPDAVLQAARCGLAVGFLARRTVENSYLQDVTAIPLNPPIEIVINLAWNSDADSAVQEAAEEILRMHQGA